MKPSAEDPSVFDDHCPPGSSPGHVGEGGRTGSAYRVGFQLDVDEADFDAHSVIMKQRATDIPFSVVEPGGQITNMFGTGPALLGEDPPLRPFTAIVTYEWQPFWSKRRRVEKRRYDIDVRPFLGLVPETTRYVLRSVDGGVVRQQKANHASGAPPHWLCANWFEEQKKSYLQKDPWIVDGGHLWACPRCSTAVMVDENTSESEAAGHDTRNTFIASSPR